MRYYAFVLFLIIGMAACTKAGSPNYFCTALINDEPWKNKYADSKPSTYLKEAAIDIRCGGKFKGYDYTFSMLNIRKENNKQQIILETSNNKMYSLFAIFNSAEEFDVTGDWYNVLENDTINNWVQIIKARKDFTRDIEGKFSGTFVREKKFEKSPFPDTIRIREGYFYIAKVGEG